MALVTKKYLVEQIRSLLGGGSPSAGAKFEPGMIETHVQQAINRKLKAEYFNVTLPNDETIPEGLILASFDNIPVETYKGLSRVKLPAMPISLRRGMGVYFVGPAKAIGGTSTLATPSLTVAAGSSSIGLSWAAITGAELYSVERSTSADFVNNLTQVYGGNALSFIDTGLTSNTTYYYRLKAYGTGYNDSAFTYNGGTTTTAGIFDDTFNNSFN